MTALKNCVCKHDYQDRKYGEGKRVANKCNGGFRCTVCDKTITSDVVKKK